MSSLQSWVFAPLLLAVGCDPTIEDPVDCEPGFLDADGDGFGGVATSDCSGKNVAVPGDCDDADSAVFPGAEEVCDGIDQNCDGSIDDELDQDGDGFRVCAGDCDDGNRLRFPGQVEVCDGEDDDCDGDVDRLCSMGVVTVCFGGLSLRTEAGDTVWTAATSGLEHGLRGVVNLGADRHAFLTHTDPLSLAVYDARRDTWETIEGPGVRLQNGFDIGGIAAADGRVFVPGMRMDREGGGVAWFDPVGRTSGWLWRVVGANAYAVAVDHDGVVWALDRYRSSVTAIDQDGRVQAEVDLRPFGRVSALSFRGDRRVIANEAGDLWVLGPDWRIRSTGKTGIREPFSVSQDTVGAVAIGGMSDVVSIHWQNLEIRSGIPVLGPCWAQAVVAGD